MKILQTVTSQGDLSLGNNRVQESINILIKQLKQQRIEKENLHRRSQ